MKSKLFFSAAFVAIASFGVHAQISPTPSPTVAKPPGVNINLYKPPVAGRRKPEKPYLPVLDDPEPSTQDLATLRDLAVVAGVVCLVFWLYFRKKRWEA